MGRAFEKRKATIFKRMDRVGKQFTKIGKEIAMAVKAGGPSPEANPSLRRAIVNARAVNMPKDRIDTAIKKAHEQFRWFGGGWKVNAELPGTAAFAGATQFVRPDDVAESIPCGPDLDKIVETATQWRDAGFTDLAFVQIGDEGQEDFIAWAEKELLPALR